MLKTWRQYKNWSIENIDEIPYQTIISGLQTARNQLTSQKYDFTIDKVFATLERQHKHEINFMGTEEVREML